MEDELSQRLSAASLGSKENTPQPNSRRNKHSKQATTSASRVSESDNLAPLTSHKAIDTIRKVLTETQIEDSLQRYVIEHVEDWYIRKSDGFSDGHPYKLMKAVVNTITRGLLVNKDWISPKVMQSTRIFTPNFHCNACETSFAVSEEASEGDQTESSYDATEDANNSEYVPSGAASREPSRSSRAGDSDETENDSDSDDPTNRAVSIHSSEVEDLQADYFNGAQQDEASNQQEPQDRGVEHEEVGKEEALDDHFVKGTIYAAKAFRSDLVKVGFSAEKPEDRIHAIDKCGVPIEKQFIWWNVPCAFRAEQIIHKVLDQWRFARPDCCCGSTNIEWFARPFGDILVIVQLVATWMEEHPYDAATGHLTDDWIRTMDLWVDGRTYASFHDWMEWFVNGHDISEYSVQVREQLSESQRFSYGEPEIIEAITVSQPQSQAYVDEQGRDDVQLPAEARSTASLVSVVALDLPAFTAAQATTVVTSPCDETVKTHFEDVHGVVQDTQFDDAGTPVSAEFLQHQSPQPAKNGHETQARAPEIMRATGIKKTTISLASNVRDSGFSLYNFMSPTADAEMVQEGWSFAESFYPIKQSVIPREVSRAPSRKATTDEIHDGIQRRHDAMSVVKNGGHTTDTFSTLVARILNARCGSLSNSEAPKDHAVHPERAPSQPDHNSEREVQSPPAEDRNPAENKSVSENVPAEKPLVEKSLPDKTLFDKPLFDKPLFGKPLFDKPLFDKTLFDKPLSHTTTPTPEIRRAPAQRFVFGADKKAPEFNFVFPRPSVTSLSSIEQQDAGEPRLDSATSPVASPEGVAKCADRRKKIRVRLPSSSCYERNGVIARDEDERSADTPRKSS